MDITRSQGHCITLQISYSPKLRLAAVSNINDFVSFNIQPTPPSSSELESGKSIKSNLMIDTLKECSFNIGGGRMGRNWSKFRHYS